MKVVEEYDDYFVQKRNTAETLGLSCLQKVVAAFRMLAYEVAADAMDDYIHIGESTALESLRKFVRKTVTPKWLTATRMRWGIVESSGSCWIAMRGNFSARGKFISARGKDRAHARASDVARDFGRW
jgi:hypothetical protein